MIEPENPTVNRYLKDKAMDHSAPNRETKILLATPTCFSTSPTLKE